MASPASPPRYVVVDDSDPSITYTGPGWSQDSSGSKDDIGNFGPTYMHTLHQTSTNGTVSFNFSGTAVKVLGTNIVKNAQTNPDPDFECFVDDVSIGRYKPLRFPENNWPFCETNNLVDGPHRLKIQVRVRSDQAFYLDRILYVPSADVSMEDKVIQYQSTDPAIQFDSHWESLGITANMTTHSGSRAKVDFYGTSLSWVAFIPKELPHDASKGTWSMDGGFPTQFLLPGLPTADTSTLYEQTYFTTPETDPGPHTLIVTFQGSAQTTPLCLSKLYIKNGAFIGGTGAPTSIPTANPPNITQLQTSSESSKSEKLLKAIWGVVAGLIFLILISVIYCFRKRLRARFRRWERYVPHMSDKEFNAGLGGQRHFRPFVGGSATEPLPEPPVPFVLQTPLGSHRNRGPFPSDFKRNV